MPVLSFLKETVADAARTVRYPSKIRELFDISLYRNSGYLMANSALNGVVGILFWERAWHYFGEEDVGLAFPAISTAMLIVLFSTLGLNFALIRYLSGSGERRGRDMINTCFAVSAPISAGVALAVLLSLAVWDSELAFLREEPLYWVGFVVLTAGFTVQTFAIHAFIAERRAGFVLVGGVIFNVLRFVPLILVGWGTIGFLASVSHAFGIFASWGIGALLAVLVGVLVFLPRVRAGYRPLPTVNLGLVREMMSYASMNYVAELLWSASWMVLPVMVLSILDESSSANFGISWQTSTPVLLMVPMAVSTALFAEGSYDENNLGRDVKKSLKLIVLLLVPGVLLICMLGDQILLFIGEDRSADATKLVWILAVSAFPVSINRVYFGVGRVQKKMKKVMSFTALLAVGTLALSAVLMPHMGIIGVGVAWLVSQTVVALLALGSLVRLARGDVGRGMG